MTEGGRELLPVKLEQVLSGAPPIVLSQDGMHFD
jgi:hypothetical protein